jgi:hypothetical protein
MYARYTDRSVLGGTEMWTVALAVVEIYVLRADG